MSIYVGIDYIFRIVLSAIQLLTVPGGDKPQLIITINYWYKFLLSKFQ